MKRLFFVCLLCCGVVNLSAQERVNTLPAELSYKSKEIKTALYWSQNSKTGKWESRKNTDLVYLGEGVAIDNFNSIFIGNYSGISYLFVDYKAYKWRYPALSLEWSYFRTIMASQLTNDDVSNLENIQVGQTVTVESRFYNDMFKGHAEYSFPFFIDLTETLRRSATTLYESYKNDKKYGKDYADRQWTKDYPPIKTLIVKRVDAGGGRDVIRFVIYPHALSELIDVTYFEIDYTLYKNLFIEDRKKTYK